MKTVQIYVHIFFKLFCGVGRSKMYRGKTQQNLLPPGAGNLMRLSYPAEQTSILKKINRKEKK